MAYFVLAFDFEPPLPITEAARDAALLAVATTAPAATLAVVLTVRIALSAMELPPLADFLGLAGFAVALAAVGVTFFGAALPKVGFASLERAATAGPAPVFDSVAFASVAFDRVALPLPGAGFLALVAIGVAMGQFSSCQHHCRIRHNGRKVLRFRRGLPAHQD
ncbi:MULTISPECIES: hypothetical protein [unclassified Mesorhizobium]|uniref:hypothetical protein n=1 Tax=unclassified Mesorhizobium TaxID=325217 RepID=UPI0013E3B9BF|nr:MULTISPECIES: hypothetical protein [unclassified Mesorhizobium]